MDNHVSRFLSTISSVVNNYGMKVPKEQTDSRVELYNYIDIPEELKPKPEPKVPEPINEEKITLDDFILKYKNDPELRKIPLPNFVYEKYNIPKPEIQPLNAFLFKSIKASMSGGYNSETRKADDKGVRKMPYLSTVEGLDLSGNPTTYMSTFTN
jgi:hypothetical protein